MIGMVSVHIYTSYVNHIEHLSLNSFVCYSSMYHVFILVWDAFSHKISPYVEEGCNEIAWSHD